MSENEDTTPKTVERIRRKLKEKAGTDGIVRKAAAVYLDSVMEYLAREVIELAGKEAADAGRKTIEPEDIQRALARDEELAPITVEDRAPVTVPGGGVVPHIHRALLPKK